MTAAGGFASDEILAVLETNKTLQVHLHDNQGDAFWGSQGFVYWRLTQFVVLFLAKAQLSVYICTELNESFKFLFPGIGTRFTNTSGKAISSGTSFPTASNKLCVHGLNLWTFQHTWQENFSVVKYLLLGQLKCDVSFASGSQSFSFVAKHSCSNSVPDHKEQTCFKYFLI